MQERGVSCYRYDPRATTRILYTVGEVHDPLGPGTGPGCRQFRYVHDVDPDAGTGRGLLAHLGSCFRGGAQDTKCGLSNRLRIEHSDTLVRQFHTRSGVLHQDIGKPLRLIDHHVVVRALGHIGRP